MDEVDKIIVDELYELAREISPEWNKIYFVGNRKLFSITVHSIVAEQIPSISEFCAKNGVTWTIMQSSDKNSKGVSVVFKNN